MPARNPTIADTGWNGRYLNAWFELVSEDDDRQPAQILDWYSDMGQVEVFLPYEVVGERVKVRNLDELVFVRPPTQLH